MECEHYHMKVNFESIEQIEDNKLQVPVRCMECGESESKEIVIEWQCTDTFDEECSHDNIKTNRNFEVSQFGEGNEVNLFIPGVCEDCGSGFYDEVDLAEK